MRYFAEQYPNFRWPVAEAERAGFRPPQLGALHAIGAHFAQHDEPGIVTMPTGSGKTAVLSAAPYVLRAARALVVTPSRLVREQIVEDLAGLRVLRRLGALPEDGPTPHVLSVRGRLADDAAWAALAEADVVVGIPTSLDPAHPGVAPPPSGLFDVVLVDEAHHSAAASWRALLGHFREARQVLFTATPFRRDRRELLGRFVYTYELARAFRDGVFGRLRYEPVDPAPGEDADLAIARAAARAIRADRAAGRDHRLMVRTGTRARAARLAELYAEHTQATLEVVLGHHSLRHVRRVIERLRSGELDGIVCVDMFGEGFDLPQLKVAALHAPHRSLAVTLQFIGRFARTTAPGLGDARFFALASDMRVERERLYRQGAVWEDIIPNLSAARAREERETREVLATFERQTAPAGPTGATSGAAAPLADLSLHALRPYFHVKVLRAGPELHVTASLAMPRGLDVVYRWVSGEHATAVYVTREVTRPEWSTVEQFDGVQHDLFVLHHHRDTNLLFVCASRRSDAVYQHFAAVCAAPGGPPLRGLSPAKLNKVLLDLSGPRFFNIGKRNALAANRSVSYETLNGSAADEQLAQSDARAYRRGHWFCSAVENGREVTLGLSSASKLWSNTVDRIPKLVAWCDTLARRLASARTPTTLSNLDLLGTGDEVSELPEGVVFADWNKATYTDAPMIRYTGPDGLPRRSLLIDFDLRVVAADAHIVRLRLACDDVAYAVTCSFQTARFVEPDPANAQTLVIETLRGPVDLVDHLNEHPPALYTADFACLTGLTLDRMASDGRSPFTPARIEVRDWPALGVDITREFGEPSASGRSIHAHLEAELAASAADIVIYDHGTGEVADFVVLTVDGQETRVTLYHCKGSGEATPGERVDDVYEVCGQVAKSTVWADRRRLRERLVRRLQTRGGATRFVRGDAAALERALGDGRYIRLMLEMVAVQPGLRRGKLSDKAGSVLAAVDDFIYGGPCARLRVLGSA